MNFKLKNPYHNPLFGFLLLSFIVHAILLTFVDWSRIPPVSKEKIFEIDLIEPPENRPLPPPKVVPVKPQKKKVAQQQSEQKTPRKKPVIGEESIVPPRAKPNIQPSKPTLLLDVSLSDSFTGNDSDTLQLSRTEITKQNLVRESEEEPFRNDILQENSPQKRIPRKDLRGEIPSAMKGIGVGQITSDAAESKIEAGFFEKYDENKKIHIVDGTDEDSKGELKKSRGARGAISIEGEAAKRKIIFAPPPPKLNLEKNITISLRFIVLPNGEVDQIFPFKKANPKLELLAIELLQKYRFEPLWENKKKQTGIIHFTLRGRR